MADHQTTTIDPQLLDLEIADAIEAALEQVAIVNQSRSRLDVSVTDGVATISGNVLTASICDAVMRTASRVPGVKKVIDRVANDIQIEMAIAGKLASDPLLANSWPSITTARYLGTVTLYGKVESEEAHQTALRLAASVPGVREVIDHLQLSTD
jgi:osmotically-inducible protein OsmY